MNEQEMRRSIIDLVLWASPEKLSAIWSFVSSYLHGEIVGVHADADYLIDHGKFLKAMEAKKTREAAQHED